MQVMIIVLLVVALLCCYVACVACVITQAQEKGGVTQATNIKDIKYIIEEQAALSLKVYHLFNTIMIIHAAPHSTTQHHAAPRSTISTMFLTYVAGLTDHLLLVMETHGRPQQQTYITRYTSSIIIFKIYISHQYLYIFLICSIIEVARTVHGPSEERLREVAARRDERRAWRMIECDVELFNVCFLFLPPPPLLLLLLLLPSSPPPLLPSSPPPPLLLPHSLCS